MAAAVAAAAGRHDARLATARTKQGRSVCFALFTLQSAGQDEAPRGISGYFSTIQFVSEK